MQNKLNEILELCVEKSKWESNTFYGFQYHAKHEIIVVSKNDDIVIHGRDINQALEYMQNE